MGSNPDLQAAELALNGGPGRGGPALGPARSPLGPRALRPPSCPRPGRSGRLQEAGPADGRGEAKGPRNRGGVEARNGRQARGREKKPESPRQDPGRWVPCSPRGCRTEARVTELQNGQREEGGREREKRAIYRPSTSQKHQGNNPFWSWRGCLLSGEEERVLQRLGKPDHRSFGTFDCPTQNIIRTKCSPLPTFLQPPTWERLLEGEGRTFK